MFVERRAVTDLQKPAEEISVGDVLRALEGSIEAVSCGKEHNANCLGEDLCVARYVWQKVNKSIQETVDSITISQLVEESRRIKKDPELTKNCSNDRKMI